MTFFFTYIAFKHGLALFYQFEWSLITPATTTRKVRHLIRRRQFAWFGGDRTQMRWTPQPSQLNRVQRLHVCNQRNWWRDIQKFISAWRPIITSLDEVAFDDTQKFVDLVGNSLSQVSAHLEPFTSDVYANSPNLLHFRSYPWTSFFIDYRTQMHVSRLA
jgi:hypothetical protein